MNIDKKIALLSELLEREYGRKEWRKENALDVLVYTIISQNTSSGNSRRAYENLTRRYDSWEDVLQADEEEIADQIKVSGLSRVKARRIKMALSGIVEEMGRLSLDLLEDEDVDKARTFLLELEGVGRKTASCVLCFAFGKPAFPVDTHIYRICNRLGLIKEREDKDKTIGEIERMMEDRLTGRKIYELHLNMIEHGRMVCRSRKPRCEDCVLKSICAFGGNG